MPFNLAKGWDDSHSSSLSGSEMLALADTIVDVPGFKKPDAGAHDFWHYLSEEVQNKNRTLLITKGIHEANRLHFNIFVDCATDLRFEKIVEVFVGLGNIPTKITTKPFEGKGGNNGRTVQRDLFTYQVKGMTVMFSNIQQNFPPHFYFGIHKPERRMSFSLGNSEKPAFRSEFPAGPKPVPKQLSKQAPRK